MFGAGPGIRLLIVGDSAAAGVGVDSQEKALSGRLISSLAPAHKVTWQVLAQTGHASGEVVARLKTTAEQAFDVVLVSLGVNDATARTGSREWANNLRELIGLLKSRFHARRILLSSVPPMHRFPALPQPLRWWLGVRAKKLNRVMAYIAGNDDACTLVAVTFPNESAYMATDGFHPGEPAYALWGDHVAKIIRDGMTKAE